MNNERVEPQRGKGLPLLRGANYAGGETQESRRPQPTQADGPVGDGAASRTTMRNSRYELKYLIDEQQASRIRLFIRSHLVPDSHADPRQLHGYPVHSLYLDSPSLELLRSSQEGLRNRFKLRLRFYDDDPQHPVFLEIKRRLDGVITKQRAKVARGGLELLLAQRRLERAERGDDGPEAVAAHREFCDRCRQLGARGIVYVSYLREAYVGRNDEAIRVTLDRHLVTDHYRAGTPLAPPSHPRRVPLPGVVLELKFSNRFPQWMQDLVQTVDLRRISLAKYVESVQALGAVPVACRDPGESVFR